MPARPTKAQRTGALPLAYLLGVLNDVSADVRRRDRAAIAALPFCHPRAEVTPKKATAAQAAQEAGAGTSWADDLGYSDGPLRQ